MPPLFPSLRRGKTKMFRSVQMVKCKVQYQNVEAEHSRVGQPAHEWISNELHKRLGGEHYSNLQILLHQLLVLPRTHITDENHLARRPSSMAPPVQRGERGGGGGGGGGRQLRRVEVSDGEGAPVALLHPRHQRHSGHGGGHGLKEGGYGYNTL